MTRIHTLGDIATIDRMVKLNMTVFNPIADFRAEYEGRVHEIGDTLLEGLDVTRKQAARLAPETQLSRHAEMMYGELVEWLMTYGFTFSDSG